MMQIDKNSVAADALLHFMINVELWVEPKRLISWLEHERRFAEPGDFEDEFYLAAIRYVEAVAAADAEEAGS